MERAWQPSMKTTAGSDILHKPGDASGVMEATSRDIEKGREEEGERFGGAGGGDCGSKYHAFRLQTPVLINTVPHTRPPRLPRSLTSVLSTDTEGWQRPMLSCISTAWWRFYFWCKVLTYISFS